MTEVFTKLMAEAGCWGLVEKALRMGKISSVRTAARVEDNIREGIVILAATWICTKSFWFLRPTDELLSFRSGRVSLGVEPR